MYLRPLIWLFLGPLLGLENVEHRCLQAPSVEIVTLHEAERFLLAVAVRREHAGDLRNEGVLGPWRRLRVCEAARLGLRRPCRGRPVPGRPGRRAALLVLRGHEKTQRHYAVKNVAEVLG